MFFYEFFSVVTSLPDVFLTIYSKKTIPYLSQPVIIFSFSYLDVQSYSYCYS